MAYNSPHTDMARLTEEQLRDRCSIVSLGRGRYHVRIVYRGDDYYGMSHNTMAWDDLHTEEASRRVWYRTTRQALLAFYDECKRFNQLR